MNEICIIMPDGEEHKVEIRQGVTHLWVSQMSVEYGFAMAQGDSILFPITRPKVKKYRWEKEYQAMEEIIRKAMEGRREQRTL